MKLDISRIRKDDGFLGQTHSISAMSLFLVTLAFFPEIVENQLQSKNPILLVACVFLAGGSALLPDFDASQSTAISSLGLLGRAISKVLRSFSLVVFNLIHTKKDMASSGYDKGAHRGFWHTLVSVIMVWGIVFFTTNLQTVVTIPGINKMVSVGFLFVCFWIFICTHLSLCSLFPNFRKKQKKNGTFGSLIVLATSVLVVLIIMVSTQNATANFNWVSFIVAFGHLCHILGDMFTKAGVPLFFPFTIKGKKWYTVRVIGIKAGGTEEQLMFLPGFIILGLGALAKIFIT